MIKNASKYTEADLRDDSPALLNALPTQFIVESSKAAKIVKYTRHELESFLAAVN